MLKLVIIDDKTGKQYPVQWPMDCVDTHDTDMLKYTVECVVSALDKAKAQDK